MTEFLNEFGLFVSTSEGRLHPPIPLARLEGTEVGRFGLDFGSGREGELLH
jgi:hypothetical protein